MPYHKIQDLPRSVRDALPTHAQEIYRSSYNNAHKEYQQRSKKNNPSENLNVVCHKVAWAAVKQKYQKSKQGQWVKRSDGR